MSIADIRTREEQARKEWVRLDQRIAQLESVRRDLIAYVNALSDLAGAAEQLEQLQHLAIPVDLCAGGDVP